MCTGVLHLCFLDYLTVACRRRPGVHPGPAPPPKRSNAQRLAPWFGAGGNIRVQLSAGLDPSSS